MKVCLSGIVLLTALAAIISCGKPTTDKSDQRAVYDPEAAKVKTDIAVTQQDSIYRGKVLVSVASTQVFKVKGDSLFNGAVFSFPPSSFAGDQDVEVEGFSTIVHKKNLEAVIDANTKALALGPSVQISWTYSEDTVLPYEILLPAPSTDLTGALTQNAGSLVVFFLKNDPVTQEFNLGYIPSSQLKVEDGFVRFNSNSYGVYQAAFIDSTPTVGKTIVSSGGLETASSEPLPSAFKLKEMNEKLYGATVQVKWDLSDYARNYEVHVSKAAGCAGPYKVVKNILTTSKNVTLTESGDNFICVFAKNSKGQTAATGNGLKIATDVSAPPAPAKPVSLGGNTLSTINLTFSWPAVTDSGPAGIRSYFVQIGTTPGGSDVFNSSVGDETKQYVSAFDGSTYYARVKAIDNAGNESEWSPVSDAVVINAD
jgi:hypothetical protein